MRRWTGGVRRRRCTTRFAGSIRGRTRTLICDGRRVIVHRSTVPSVARAGAAPGTVIAAGRERHRRRLRRRAGAAAAGPAARRRPTAAGRGVPGRARSAPPAIGARRRDRAGPPRRLRRARRAGGRAPRSGRRRWTARGGRSPIRATSRLLQELVVGHDALAVAARRRHRAAVPRAAGQAGPRRAARARLGAYQLLYLDRVPPSAASTTRWRWSRTRQEVQRGRSGQRRAAARWRPARAGDCRPAPPARWRRSAPRGSLTSPPSTPTRRGSSSAGSRASRSRSSSAGSPSTTPRPRSRCG